MKVIFLIFNWARIYAELHSISISTNLQQFSKYSLLTKSNQLWAPPPPDFKGGVRTWCFYTHVFTSTDSGQNGKNQNKINKPKKNELAS